MIYGRFWLDCMAMDKKSEDSPGKKLFCDAMLGKLSRELRAIGVDVEYQRGRSGMLIYRKARAQDRVFLTRSTRLRELPGVFFITSQEPSEQLAQVKSYFGIAVAPDRRLNRCLECNLPLEKITREQARPAVPFFIYQIHYQFQRCPKCKRVFWPGSHTKDMAKRVLPGSVGRPRPRKPRPR